MSHLGAVLSMLDVLSQVRLEYFPELLRIRKSSPCEQVGAPPSRQIFTVRKAKAQETNFKQSLASRQTCGANLQDPNIVQNQSCLRRPSEALESKRPYKLLKSLRVSPVVCY